MTGVTTLADLLVAPVAQRPTLISADLSGLLHAHTAVHVDAPGHAMLEGMTARVTPDGADGAGAGRLTMSGVSAELRADHGRADALRVAVAAAWSALDTGLVHSVNVDDRTVGAIEASGSGEAVARPG
jgi:hypothetical protein